VQTFGTGVLGEDEIARRLLLGFDFRLGAIVRDLDLHQLPARHPDGFYRRLAAYGQMGRLDLDPPWERLDRLAVLTGG
jgi:S-adenosylmethionine synthetase